MIRNMVNLVYVSVTFISYKVLYLQNKKSFHFWVSKKYSCLRYGARNVWEYLTRNEELALLRRNRDRPSTVHSPGGWEWPESGQAKSTSSSRSPMWAAGAQVLGPYSMAFPWQWLELDRKWSSQDTYPCRMLLLQVLLIVPQCQP